MLSDGAAPRTHVRTRFPEVLANERSNPPHRVRREAGTGIRIELLDRAHEANVPLLDEIVQAYRAAGLLPRDGDDEREIVTCELFLRGDVAATSAHGERVLGSARQRRELANHLDVRGEIIGLISSLRRRLLLYLDCL